MRAPPKPRAARASVPVDGRPVAVVADTHGHPHPGSLDHLAALRPAAIVHAGDIGGGTVLDDLAAIAPLYAIRGNIDPRGLPDELTLDLTDDGRVVMRMFVVHIGVNGPRLRADAAALATQAGAQLVVCGHSHVPFVGRDRGLVVFNPGSVGPRRFQLPIVYGVLSFGPDGARLSHRDAATGQPWAPEAPTGPTAPPGTGSPSTAR